MDDKDSRKLLQQLHDEINNIQSVDENSSDLLRDIDGDIHALLERSGEHPMEVHPTIIEQLRIRSINSVTHRADRLISKVLIAEYQVFDLIQTASKLTVIGIKGD
jgi:hypothetical protein